MPSLFGNLVPIARQISDSKELLYTVCIRPAHQISRRVHPLQLCCVPCAQKIWRLGGWETATKQEQAESHGRLWVDQ